MPKIGNTYLRFDSVQENNKHPCRILLYPPLAREDLATTYCVKQRYTGSVGQAQNANLFQATSVCGKEEKVLQNTEVPIDQLSSKPQFLRQILVYLPAQGVVIHWWMCSPSNKRLRTIEELRHASFGRACKQPRSSHFNVSTI